MMRSILISLDGSVYHLYVEEKLRGGVFQMCDKIPVSANYHEWITPEVMRIRTRFFKWRAQIIRKNGSDLLDVFEEVED